MDTPDESKSQGRELTTTSYAVLSILALRDHSTYDLTRQMRLSLHYLWPRAESNVYAEPKRLVDAGLAEARDEWQGQRRRKVYSITRGGRIALAMWLASASSPPRYESEALAKVLFGENGTVADLLRAVGQLSEDAAAVVRHFMAVADDYAAGKGAYPRRFGLSGLAARLILEQQQATMRWARWAGEVIAQWDSPLSADSAWGVKVIREAGQLRAQRDDAEPGQPKDDNPPWPDVT